MRKLVTTTLIGGLIAMFGAGTVLAVPTDDPGIRKREQNQERRIDQGIKSGQLTPKEAGKLEAEQARIKQDEERMKADGKLTRKERRELNKELDRSSRDIYKKKHNKRKGDVN